MEEAIADYHVDFAINAKQVFVGNGSDEAFAHIFQGLLKHDKPILFCDITYSFYLRGLRLYQIESTVIPLTDSSFEINPEDYKRPNGGIIFPNPNAPTGRYLGLQHVEEILQANPDSVVVVDEAYVDFGGDTAIRLVNQHPNLLVCQRDLSKARSLAGLRVGFAVGNEELIEALNRVKDSFNTYPLDRLGCWLAPLLLKTSNGLEDSVAV